jgi:peptidoglycan/xylan/chitin deacetylase (PgdA/CDA1 family)
MHAHGVVRPQRMTAEPPSPPSALQRSFVVCIHDASPAWARETQLLLRDLAPLVGRRLSIGVVPDWHGAWSLTAHPEYCGLVREHADELLLHGYQHRRRRGTGPVSWLTARSDEMNGLDTAATRRALECGQRVFTEAFGGPARGFIAPAWQAGRVRDVTAATDDGAAAGLDHIVGFFSIDSTSGGRVPLATWTWDCGRWDWLGHVGHGLGWTVHALHRAVPVLAIHPRDLERGYRSRIVRLIAQLRDAGREPCTAADLLRCIGC